MFCDQAVMPLESCPTCGSALSILSHECRNCVTAASKFSWIERPDGKHTFYYVLTLLTLIFVLYVLFRT